MLGISGNAPNSQAVGRREELVEEKLRRRFDSGDELHGQALELAPDGLVFAVIKNSETWGPVRIEADFLFPEFLFFSRSVSQQRCFFNPPII